MTMVRDFRCNGCGAPLEIPKNSKGNVRCPSCKTECVIEGLVKNAEIAAKENINSGISLSASPALLHNALISCIAESSAMPLDVFEKGEVVREETHCIPAYCFYCNGTSSFTYEKGVETSQLYDVKTKKGIGTQERIHTEWHPGSSSASVSMAVFASGNRKLAAQINSLYGDLDPRKLIDFEELDFPAEVETHSYDLPQPAAFNEYVEPKVEMLLQEKAKGSVAGQNIRNFTSGGYSIQKDVVRVFLGMYRIVFKYDDKEYSIWVTGDGEKIINEGMPVDEKQKKIIDEKKQEMEQNISAIPVPKAGKFTAGLWGSIVVGIILSNIIGALGMFLGIVGAITFGVLKKNMMKPYKTQCTEIRTNFQTEIDALQAEAKNTAQKFKTENRTLRGIYEGINVSTTV